MRAVWALAAATLLHGLLSSPAPGSVRWIEVAVGGLLVLGVGPRAPLAVAFGEARDDEIGGRVAVPVFFWLLWVPLARGALMGWEAERIVRDVVPLLFLFAPLVIVPTLVRAGPRGIEGLAWAAAIAGLFLTLRWGRRVDWAALSGAPPDTPNYLLNAPFVLFAAVFAIGRGLDRLSRGSLRLPALAAIAGGLACLAAPIAAVHRAALIAAPPALLTAGWGALRRSRALLGGLTLGLVAGGLALGPRLAEAIGNAFEKSRQVGLNARVEEATAAIERAAADPAALLFGSGWGALLVDPAVGDWRVAYTHTALSYFLFKAGLFGIAALGLWLGALARPAARAFARDPTLASAAAAPILTALTVQSAYKYLDTGILLSLLLATGARNPLPEKRSRA